MHLPTLMNGTKLTSIRLRRLLTTAGGRVVDEGVDQILWDDYVELVCILKRETKDNNDIRFNVRSAWDYNESRNDGLPLIDDNVSWPLEGANQERLIDNVVSVEIKACDQWEKYGKQKRTKRNIMPMYQQKTKDNNVSWVTQVRHFNVNDNAHSVLTKWSLMFILSYMDNRPTRSLKA